MTRSARFTDFPRPNASAPPPVEQFPEYPLSWYLFGPAGELRDKPQTRSLLGRELVGFRTASGRVAVLDARCAHQGADLGRGGIVGEAIQCPFHNWQYGADGRCVGIPAQAAIPSFARQRAYPTVERHGYVFFFNGPQPSFELPFFAGCRPDAYRSGRVLTLFADCPWYLFSSNAFDAQHWNAIHHREVIEPPAIDSPQPWTYRIRLRARVSGPSIWDRLLRRFVGQVVEIEIVNYGGTFSVVSGFFPVVQSRMFVCTAPLGPGKPLRVDTIVFGRTGSSALLRAFWDPFSLWCRRLFTHAFIKHEFEELAGIRYNPQTLIDADRDMIGWFQWAAALPRESAPSERREVCGASANAIPANRECATPSP